MRIPQSTSSVEKHLPTSSSLCERIQAVVNLRTSSKFAEAITALANLFPHLTSFISYTGERKIAHDAYTDSASLNEIALLWMRLGSDCADHDAPFRSRLLQYSLFEELRSLYRETEKSLNDSTVLWFLNSVQEFQLGCAHCHGSPQYCVLHEEGRMRDEALYVRAEIYRKVWPDHLKQGFMDGLSTRLSRGYINQIRVSITQLEEAAALENEEQLVDTK